MQNLDSTGLKMKTTLRYKNLEIIRVEKLNLIELTLQDSYYNADTYIDFITMVLEYIEKKRPHYVLFNKLNVERELSRATLNFTKNIIFTQMKAQGVKKILMVVNESQFEESYRNIDKKIEFMKGFDSLENAYSWVEEYSKVSINNYS